MAYVSLYRKYRPQTFTDVIGQEHVTRTLQNAIRAGRIAHGYLFTGTRGTAKTTVARLLAKTLNCDKGPAPEPCNACDACVSVTNGSCIDVIEMDAASHRGVADIEEVRKAVGYGPMQFRYKVFIIDEAHQLSSDAKDAFLKTLEEPPENVVFVLATTEPQSIPITIRSRCQQFDFKRGSLADIAGRLRYVLDQEGVTYTPEAVNLVARGAEGSYRDALSLLEQVLAFSPRRLTSQDVDAVLGTLDAEMLARVTEVIASHDAPTAFALAGEMLDAGKEARTLLRTLSAHFRDLLLVSVGGPAVASELTPEEVGRLQHEARRFSPPQMLRALDILNEAQGETRWNNQHRLLVELTFLKLMNLSDGTGERANGNSTTFATAPIVFPSPVAAAVMPPPGRPSSAAPNNGGAGVPSSPSPFSHAAGEGEKEVGALLSAPSAAAPDSPPPPLLGAADDGRPGRAEPESLSATYFADDDVAGAEDDEFFLLDDEAVPPLADEAPVPEPEEDTGPGLFDEPEEIAAPAMPAAAAALPAEPVRPTPAAASPPLPQAADDAELSQELAAVLSPSPRTEIRDYVPPAPVQRPSPAVTARSSSSDGPENFAPISGLTVEKVVQVWPRFLQAAERISKRASVMLSSAAPTDVSGKTITITFAGRANHEMMSMPSQQKFVRELLARCLGIDSVQVNYALNTNAPPPPPAAPRTKVRRERDLTAAMDGVFADEGVTADHSEPAGASAFTAPSASAFAVPASPPPPRPSARPESAQTAPPMVAAAAAAVADKAESYSASAQAAALEDPLVQEALSIFGGELVNE